MISRIEIRRACSVNDLKRIQFLIGNVIQNSIRQRLVGCFGVVCEFQQFVDDGSRKVGDRTISDQIEPVQDTLFLLQISHQLTFFFRCQPALAWLWRLCPAGTSLQPRLLFGIGEP